MNLEWDAKVGPATIVGFFGSLGVLVAIGMAWGSLKSDVQNTVIIAGEAKVAAKTSADKTTSQDEKIAVQAERLGKIETSITFIVPTLQRIESKLDAVPKTPH